MRSTLAITIAAALLILSLGLRPPAPDAAKIVQQASSKLETALLSNNATNTKIAMLEILETLGGVALNYDACPLNFKMLNTFLDAQDFDLAVLLITYNSFNNVNRACFPIVNLVRSLIVGGAQVLGLNTSMIPEFKNNKIISFDLPNNFVANSILVAEDAVRFAECYVATAFWGITMLNYDLNSLYGLRSLALFGGNAVGPCREAISLAYDIYNRTHQEAKVVAEIEKISTMLYAQDNNNEIELAAFNKTVSTALDTIKQLGYADLCLSEITAVMYQLSATMAVSPDSLRPYLLISQALLSIPYSANEDCLPFANLAWYAFLEAGNLALGLNNTFTPREGSILKIADFGFPEGGFMEKLFGAFGTGLDTMRCVSASVATVLIVGNGYQLSGDSSAALSIFEQTVLQALAGETSCTNVYTTLRQHF